MTDPGVDLVEVHLAAAGIEQVLFSQAITVRRPRVLYIAGGEGALPRRCLKLLKRAQVDVEPAAVASRSIPKQHELGRGDSSTIIPIIRCSPDEQDAIEKYVFTGGGLIFIAGENNAQLAVDPHTPFEKLLPVSGDPPPPPEEPTALVLVLDKSRSMDGPKIAMVREAARASLATLRPIDKIGVIAFDETPQWVVPLTAASDVPRISGLINTITADGGTRIYPAVEMAFDAIRAEHVTRRHIILLTDGVSPPGNLPQLEKSAAAEHITISTIGVGSDVDRSLLEELAREARGKSYFLDDPNKIPQVISGETRDLQASTVEERSVKVVRVRPVEFIDGIDFTHAPRLLGFAKEKAKKGSETILKLDSGEPLLVRWQYGLGQSGRLHVGRQGALVGGLGQLEVATARSGRRWCAMFRIATAPCAPVCAAGTAKANRSCTTTSADDCRQEDGARPSASVHPGRRKLWSTRRAKLRTPCRSKKPRRVITKRAFRTISAACIASFPAIPSSRCPKPAFIASRRK